MKNWVNQWSDKEHVTLPQLHMLTTGIQLPWIMPGEEYIPPKDYNGDVIENFEEWRKQRDEYLEMLWKELGSYKENNF